MTRRVEGPTGWVEEAKLDLGQNGVHESYGSYPSLAGTGCLDDEAGGATLEAGATENVEDPDPVDDAGATPRVGDGDRRRAHDLATVGDEERLHGAPCGAGEGAGHRLHDACGGQPRRCSLHRRGRGRGYLRHGGYQDEASARTR